MLMDSLMVLIGTLLVVGVGEAIGSWTGVSAPVPVRERPERPLRDVRSKTNLS